MLLVLSGRGRVAGRDYYPTPTISVVFCTSRLICLDFGSTTQGGTTGLPLPRLLRASIVAFEYVLQVSRRGGRLAHRCGYFGLCN